MIYNINKMNISGISESVNHIKNKDIILRLDFNTRDDWRINAVLLTIRLALKLCHRLIIISHKGRPKKIDIRRGVPYGPDTALTLEKDGKYLQRLLKKKVHFSSHFMMAKLADDIKKAPMKTIFLMENLRFLDGEEKNDYKFAGQLARLGQVYINDAFAVCHRKNASTVSITRFLPSFAGLNLESEIKHLTMIRQHPQKPFIIILGGSKAHDKLPVIKYFKRKADIFILGGAVANTILRKRGIDIMDSVADLNSSKHLTEVARYPNLVLPEDYVVFDRKILDIGPKSIKKLRSDIARARTIVWNGPFGLIEESRRFTEGSLAIARAIIRNKKAFSLVGGGETVMFLRSHKFDKKISFISTGGGAMLEFLAGKKLPGIEALKR